MRDVAYSARLGRLATLTTNGAVQLWDPHLSPIRTVRAPPTLCLPCMGMQEPGLPTLFSASSQAICMSWRCLLYSLPSLHGLLAGAGVACRSECSAGDVGILKLKLACTAFVWSQAAEQSPPCV